LRNHFAPRSRRYRADSATASVSNGARSTHHFRSVALAQASPTLSFSRP
jgi:hypothetical protein